MLEEKEFMELEKLLKEMDFRALKNFLADMHEFDIAEFFEEKDRDSAAILFRLLAKEQAAEVFSLLDSDQQQSLIEAFSDVEVSDIIEDLYTDDAVDMLEELPANAVSRILRLATPETRKTLNHFMKYEEDTAGSIMTSEYVAFRKSMTVLEAIGYLRSHGANSETIYTCYIMDATRKLLGVISVRELLLAQDTQILSEIMEENVISVDVGTDQEDVAHIFADYGFLSLPVVDRENRLVGIVTFDDAWDVSQQETTEDMEIMGAMNPSDKPYLKSSVFSLSQDRIVWLMVLMFSGMLNGLILERYEHIFVAMPALVAFMPMLTGTGGNSGAQSSTTVIRGMALGEIEFKDIFSVLWKEIRISILAGLSLAAVNFIRVYFFYGRDAMLAATVSFALVAIIFFAKICGSMLPILAQKLKLDPAIMAAPIITTIVDALGFIINFNLAGAMLG